MGGINEDIELDLTPLYFENPSEKLFDKPIKALLSTQKMSVFKNTS